MILTQALDVIEADGDFLLVAAYLRSVQGNAQNGAGSSTNGEGSSTFSDPLPSNVSVRMQTAEEAGDDLPVIDEAFKQKIEELASRGDFKSEESQRELRELVTEAVHQHVLDPEASRNVRPRDESL